MKAWKAIALVLPVAAASLLIGCHSDNRPEYVAPQLPPDQAVTIKTEKGCFVDGIDGAKVKASQVTLMGVIGGHTVTASPGDHAIDVFMNTSNFRVYRNFHYTFDAGTTYEFAPNSIW